MIGLEKRQSAKRTRSEAYRLYPDNTTTAGRRAMPTLSILLWRLLALLTLALGFIGIVVPGLPTVPFLLLAAWCGSRGWPRLEAWLLAHPRYGDTIAHWREHRAIPRKAKWAASAMMLLSCASLLLFPTPLALRIGLPLLLLCIALWIWRRPEA